MVFKRDVSCWQLLFTYRWLIRLIADMPVPVPGVLGDAPSRWSALVQQQDNCQREAEAIQIIVKFTFRNMPNHFFMAVGCRLSAISKGSLWYSSETCMPHIDG